MFCTDSVFGMAEDQAEDDDFDVVSLLRKRLPKYIVNCFLAAGYDVPDVISSMDTSEQPGNSIQLIENFIDQHYSGHKDFQSNPALVQKPFVFPPGHWLRICNFVSEVKQKHRPVVNTSQRKRKCLAPSASSKKLGKVQTVTQTQMP